MTAHGERIQTTNFGLDKEGVEKYFREKSQIDDLHETTMFSQKKKMGQREKF